MSYEYTGQFPSPLDAASIASIGEQIEALDYLEVVRRDGNQWGIRLRILPSSSWNEHLSVELSQEAVHLACHGGRGKEAEMFVRDLLIILSDQGADCTLIEM